MKAHGGKVGRNEACPCGSGRKYKQCCAAKRERMSVGVRLALLAGAGAVIAAILLGITQANRDGAAGPRRVWSAEHGHYHDVR